MTTNPINTAGRPSAGSPLERWANLPVGAKLRVSIIAVLLLALILVLAAVQSSLVTLLNDRASAQQRERIASGSSAITNLLTTTNTDMVALVHASDSALREYLDTAAAHGSEAELRFPKVNLSTAFLNWMADALPIYDDVRFVDATGQQIARAYRTHNARVTNITPETELLSEKDKPYFPALLTLTPERAYLAAVEGSQGRTIFHIGLPIYRDGKPVGAVLMSVLATDALNRAIGPDYAERGYSMALVDDGRQVLAAATGAGQRYVFDGQPYQPAEPFPTAIFKSDTLNAQALGQQLISAQAIPIDAVSGTQKWRLIVIQDQGVVLAELNRVTRDTTLPLLFIFGAVIGFTYFIGRRMTDPIREITAAARRIAAGDLNVAVPVRGSDEFGQMGQSLNAMVQQASVLIDTLEARVATRTRDIEVAAEISRDATSLRQIDELLQKTVDSIRDRFNFYHVQVFLIDSNRQYAVLITSTGEPGRKLLERKHKLAVGSASIIGQVTEKGRPFVTLDTQNSAVPHKFNPLLPNTRSEMALPMRVSNRVIGALDVQSVKPNAFDDSNTQVFQVLADQLAVAIDNARLINETQQGVQQVADLNRQLTREGWRDFLQQEGKKASAFQYDMLNVTPIEPESLTTGKNGMTAEIRVRGETIGSLSALSEDNTAMTKEDQAILTAVADRVALAVENARLVQRTQIALAEIERLYQAARALGSAPDLESVYTVVALQMAQSDAIEQFTIWSAGPAPIPNPAWFTLNYAWYRAAEQTRSFNVGDRVPIEKFAMVRLLKEPNTPVVINNVDDLQSDPVAYQLMQSGDTLSLMLSPITTGGRWFGLAVIAANSRYAFNDAFVQFASAITDQLAVAVENRQLFDEAQSEARRNRALAEAAQVSSQIGLDFKEGISNLLNVVAATQTYDRWWFGQLSIDGMHLERIASRYEADQKIESMDTVTLDEDQTALGEVARLGTPVLVNELDHYLLEKLPREQALAYGKHLAVPILSGSKLIGVLMVGRDFKKPDIDEGDWQLVSALGNQLAVAMENRRLFNSVEDGRQTLQSVLNSLPTGVLVLDAKTRQITLSNNQADLLLGLNGEEPVSIDEFPEGYLTPDFAPNRVLENGEPVVAEDITVTLPGGQTMNVLVNAAPIFDADGVLLSSVTVLTDTTDLRELETALQDNLRETTSLYEASRLIFAQENFSSILEIVMTQIFQFMQPDQMFVVLQDERREITQVYSGIMDTRLNIEQLRGDLPFPRTLLTEAGDRVVENVGLLADTQPRRPNTTPRRSRLVSAGSFPLKARNRIVGWLVVGYNTRREIAGDERRFVSAISDQAAIAAETSRLAAQTTEALRETEALYLASRSINNATTIEAVAGVMRDQALRLDPDRVDVFVLSTRNQADRVEWVVRYEKEPPAARATLILHESYITDTALLTHEALYVEDLISASAGDTDIVQRLPSAENVQAQMSIPLRVKGSIIGRLVISFFAPRTFIASEKQFVSTLAEQASVIIDNVVLYRQGQEVLEETQTLYRASRAVADATNDAGVLQAIIDHAVPPTVSRAFLVKLFGSDWSAPDASMEIAADWARLEGFNMSGMRFTSSQFPAWKDFATPDIMWIDNVQDSPSLNDESRTSYDTFDLAAFVVVPLVASGKTIGAMLLGSAEPREHSERELRVYTSLADQAAISMENRNLLRQAETRARQLATSAEVGQAATSILNLDELLNKTVNLIRQSFSYDHVQIFLISDDGRNAVLQSSTGEAGRQLIAIRHSLPVGSSSVIGRVTQLGKLYNVIDTADLNSTHRANPYLPNTRSELALPLIAKGRIVGALDVQSNQPSAFSAEDQRVLATLADQVAVAIDNASLFELSNRRLEEQRFLFNVTRTAAAVEIEVALSRVTRLMLENTNADLALLMLLDEEGKRLIPTYAAKDGARYIIPSSLPLNSSFMAGVTQSKQPVLLKEGAENSLFNPDDVPDLQSLALVPLLAGNQFVGVIAVASLRRNAYTEDTIQLLQALSGTLTAIIQNARLLREVQEANQRLREVDKLKSQFLANMSHELRTPLNSIIGFSRVILKGIDGPLNETQSQDLSTIHESGKHLLNLVNDILDQAKIEAGKMELSPTFFSIVELVKSVMSTAVGLVKDKPIRLHQELQADLPNVYADEFRTRQVLLNMLSNAAKFTRQGSITVSTFMIDDGGRPMIQISVTDTGIGISKENIRRVFAQFEQVDNSTARGAEGTGLGMPIAKSLIELQGGRIWLESEVGIGSTFSITIPTQAPDQPEGMPPPEEVSPELEAQVEQAIAEAETPDHREHRIVVVIDDEAGMISLYRRYLVKAGYEIIGTTNPDDGADLIVNYQPRVVLLDVNMPKRNGWEVLQLLKDKDETFQFPVIVCSIEDDKPRAYSLGAADYLIKPFLEEDLVSAIRRVELERDLPRVLVIEQNPELLYGMRMALTAEQDVLRVIEATDGNQGVDMITSQRPHLVILDWRTASANGVNVLDKIRNNPESAAMRVLIVTDVELDTETRARLKDEHVELRANLGGDALLQCVKQQLELSG